MLIECLLAYGAVVGNVIYLFNIRIPLLLPGLAFVTLFGGIFTGCPGWSSGRGVKCVPDHFKAVFRQTVYSLCDLCGGCR